MCLVHTTDKCIPNSFERKKKTRDHATPESSSSFTYARERERERERETETKSERERERVHINPDLHERPFREAVSFRWCGCGDLDIKMPLA